MIQLILFTALLGLNVNAENELQGSCGTNLVVRSSADIEQARQELLPSIRAVETRLAQRFADTAAATDERLIRTSGSSPGLSLELNREVLDFYLKFNAIAGKLEPQGNLAQAGVGVRAVIRKNLNWLRSKLPESVVQQIARHAEEMPKFAETRAALDGAITRALERNQNAEEELRRTKEEFEASMADRLSLIEIVRRLQHEFTNVEPALQADFKRSLILPVAQQIANLDERLRQIETFVALRTTRIEVIARNLETVRSEMQIHFNTIQASVDMIATNDQIGRLNSASRDLRGVAQRSFAAAVESTAKLVEETDALQALTVQKNPTTERANTQLRTALIKSEKARKAYEDNLSQQMLDYDKRTAEHEQRLLDKP